MAEKAIRAGLARGRSLIPEVLRFLRGRLGLVVIAFVLFLPLMANHGAGRFVDLDAYVRGGYTAVDRVVSLLNSPPETHEEGGPARPGLVPAEVDVSGVRSVTYSVTAYLLALVAPAFSALAAFQIAVLGALLLLLFGAADVDRRILLAALVVTPGAGWHAAEAGPDVWAGYLILATVILMVYRQRLPWTGKLFLLFVVAFAAASHASHLPLAAGLIGTGAAVVFWPKRDWQAAWRAASLPALGLILGAGVTALTGLIGFGEASLAPKRYPLALARSIEDGPAREHLVESCDTYNYTVCEFFPGEIPSNIHSFLWAEEGIVQRATAEEMDQIRAEEVVILRRSAADNPVASGGSIVGNVVEQLSKFAISTGIYKTPPRYVGSGAVVYPSTSEPSALLKTMPPIHIFGIVLACASFAVAWFGGWRPDGRAVLVLAIVLSGFLINAAVCGALSAPVNRYQARVIWVLPIVAALLTGPWFVSRLQPRK